MSSHVTQGSAARADNRSMNSQRERENSLHVHQESWRTQRRNGLRNEKLEWVTNSQSFLEIAMLTGYLVACGIFLIPASARIIRGKPSAWYTRRCRDFLNKAEAELKSQETLLTKVLQEHAGLNTTFAALYGATVRKAREVEGDAITLALFGRVYRNMREHAKGLGKHNASPENARKDFGKTLASYTQDLDRKKQAKAQFREKSRQMRDDFNKKFGKKANK